MSKGVGARVSPGRRNMCHAAAGTWQGCPPILARQTARTTFCAMMNLSRRNFLAAGAAIGAGAIVPSARASSHALWTELSIGTRVIDVKGKAAKVFGLLQPD